MAALRTFMIARFGGYDLGILSIPPRTTRTPWGGVQLTPSVHNWGTAWDWGWNNKGNPDATHDERRGVADKAVRWLQRYAVDLAVTMVIDEQRSESWKSERDVEEDDYTKPREQQNGWKDVSIRFMRWAQWLHIERHPTFPNGAHCVTPVADIAYPEIGLGSAGSAVKRWQDCLVRYYSQKVDVDGRFGPKTLRATQDVQKFLQAHGVVEMEPDGIVDVPDWTFACYIADTRGEVL